MSSEAAVTLTVADAAAVHYAAWVFCQLGMHRSSKFLMQVNAATRRLESQLESVARSEFPIRCLVCRRATPMHVPHVCFDCYRNALRRIADGDVAVVEEMEGWP